ncbi:DUF4811 domain-containing protein [Limosilactobacillus sp. STM2_1]|uniref:DUF4811 domain-containing protein n=1 Tax=Limosilactobacillus rudii TaxID=2759755 RepID=A0A7W3YN86_9LACO|nr:DUF4811 domain-containing protein [Limosilactobacillus rudii]MBB1079662.1 DUF4811 domain-containing protein [Limosilactobacillus rudii]MBB1097878.1 DUF4811 domain-containing protein [Limosilactobacillus rudii]MCD7134959.1 DUF4811 domain-containing protein [Limosilactobacillus rudii]
MVIILTFLGALCFFACMMFIHQKQLRITLATITGIIFIGSTTLMTLNYSHHFGMHQVTTTTSKRIYSASNSSMPLALYQPVGKSGQDNVYIYNTKQRQKTPDHTQANEYTSSKIKWTKNTTPRLITTETRWQYKNNFYKVLYAWSGMQNTLVKRTNVLEYPQSYVKLTTNQAKKLSEFAKSPAGKQAQGQALAQGRAFVTSKVQAAMAKNPQMTAKQIQEVSTQAEQEFQAQSVKQILKQIKIE